MPFFTVLRKRRQEVHRWRPLGETWSISFRLGYPKPFSWAERNKILMQADGVLDVVARGDLEEVSSFVYIPGGVWFIPGGFWFTEEARLHFNLYCGIYACWTPFRHELIMCFIENIYLPSIYYSFCGFFCKKKKRCLWIFLELPVPFCARKMHWDVIASSLRGIVQILLRS